MNVETLKKEIRLTDLWKQIHQDYRVLRGHREERKDNVKEFLGRNWTTTDSNAEPVPVPYLTVATNILIAHIASRTPEIQVYTPYPQLRSMAEKLRLAVNHVLREICLRRTLRCLLTDAIIGPAICKTALGAGPTIQLAGEDIADLQPFCDRVSLDNFVMDMTVSNVEEADYMGDFYWARLSDVQSDDLFFPDERAKVKEYPIKRTNEEGEEETASMMLPEGAYSAYHKRCRLLNVFLRTEQKIATLVVGQENLLLRYADWKGPRHGMYGVFGFHYVPDSALRLAPAGIWKEIHVLANDLYKKIATQARNQKVVVLVRKNQTEEGRAIVAAPDMEVIGVVDPNGVREVNFNGPDAANLGFFIQNERLFNRMSGNIEVLGGLAQQGDTLGQERIVKQSAGVQVSDMEAEFYYFTERIIHDIAHLLWYHPYKIIPLIKRVPGLNTEVNSEFRSDAKDGEFFDYNLEILIGSMRARSQEEQLSALLATLRNVVAPFWQIYEQQGAMLDGATILRDVALYGHLPQILDWVRFRGAANSGQPIIPGNMQVGKPIVMPQAGGAPSGVPQSTRTEDGNAMAVLQNLLGQAGSRQAPNSAIGA